MNTGQELMLRSQLTQSRVEFWTAPGVLLR
jgi:hypothetical protein